MRILHISHTGLPDIRVEKMAFTMKTRGHDVVFLGAKPTTGQNLGAFEETYYLPLGNSLNIVFDPRVKQRWLKKIRELKPDVVHAHNIIVGHFLISEDIPTIFSEQELMSKETSKFAIRPFVRRMAVKPLEMSLAKWERSLGEQCPVITVHPNMTKEYEKFARFVTTVPNVPLKREVEGLKEAPSRSGNVYVGRDFNLDRFIPYRNLEGLKNLIEFDVIYGLPHRELLQRLMHYKVGLTAWHPHPMHYYADPNRNYEYLHGGLPVLTNKIIKSALFSKNPYVFAFNEYDEIPDLIQTMEDVDHQHIRALALENYVWEKFENRILDAYKAI
ncbi:MAG: glycosyltransferase [Candidatus Thorarchaeota archaeon]